MSNSIWLHVSRVAASGVERPNFGHTCSLSAQVLPAWLTRILFNLRHLRIQSCTAPSWWPTKLRCSPSPTSQSRLDVETPDWSAFNLLFFYLKETSSTNLSIKIYLAPASLVFLQKFKPLVYSWFLNLPCNCLQIRVLWDQRSWGGESRHEDHYPPEDREQGVQRWADGQGRHTEVQQLCRQPNSRQR